MAVRTSAARLVSARGTAHVFAVACMQPAMRPAQAHAHARSGMRAAMQPREGGQAGAPRARVTLGRPSARLLPAAAAPGGGGGGPRGPPRRATAVGASGGDGGRVSGSAGGLWGWYLRMLEQYPLLTKATTCALLNALGDVFAQVCVEGAPTFDAPRTARFAAIGFVLTGPVVTFWYDLLARLLPASTLGGATSTIASLAIDQLLFAPICIASFFAIVKVVEGQVDAVVPKLQADLWEAVKANWLLWVPAQAINFSVVPLHLRTPFVSVVAILWNVYLSWSSHK